MSSRPADLAAHQRAHEEKHDFLQKIIEENNYLHAEKALALVQSFYKGNLRDDGISPAVDHPIDVAIRLYHDRNLHGRNGFKNTQRLVSVGLLHDVPEDIYRAKRNGEMTPEFMEAEKQLHRLFPRTYVDSAKRLSKYLPNGQRLAQAEYLGGLLAEEWPVKLVDRLVNSTTMAFLKHEQSPAQQAQAIANHITGTQELLQCAEKAAQRDSRLVEIVEHYKAAIEAAMESNRNMAKAFENGQGQGIRDAYEMAAEESSRQPQERHHNHPKRTNASRPSVVGWIKQLVAGGQRHHNAA